ncbi:MAG: hypothetical protein N4A47_03795 [Clostridia bacterium]|jgi:hypothetical protein|nr:hypothetical protein [Clostridia bacterium]
MSKRMKHTVYETKMTYMKDGKLVTENGELKVTNPLLNFTKKFKTLSSKGMDIVSFAVIAKDRVESQVKSVEYKNQKGENSIVYDTTRCEIITVNMTDDFLDIEKRTDILDETANNYSDILASLRNPYNYSIVGCEDNINISPYGYEITGTRINTKRAKSKDYIEYDTEYVGGEDTIEAIKEFAEKNKVFDIFSSDFYKTIEMKNQATSEKDMAIYKYQADVGPKLIIKPDDNEKKIIVKFKPEDHMSKTIRQSKNEEDFKYNILLDPDVIIEGDLGLGYVVEEDSNETKETIKFSEDEPKIEK